MLEMALHSREPMSSAWTMFHLGYEVLHRGCTLHGVVVVDGGPGDYGDAQLRHFFTGMCMLTRGGAVPVACNEVREGLQNRAE